MRRRSLYYVLIALFAFLVWLGYTARHAEESLTALPAFSLISRPDENRYLYDYAGILRHYEEGAGKYLHRIAQRFQIEAVVISVPDLGDADSMEALAVDLVNAWGIGKDYGGRGVLILLAGKEQEVKLEVSYELEDVFTDAFTGYVEDLQLKPYFIQDDIGTGLIAVMEEIERRAQLKQQGEYSRLSIARLDDQLLSGGAGATRSLTQYRDEEVETPAAAGTPGQSGASTPSEAWQTMLAKWAGRGAQIEKNIYTRMTRLAMGDPDKPDARTRKVALGLLDTGYEVLQDDNHAVIWFGNREGWNFAPFLLCRTDSGWKFDIVYQRRLVVMTENPHWKVEQGDFPYVDLLAEAKQSTGKDLPLRPEDVYTCDRDDDIARRIASLEQQLHQEPESFDTVMQLARLNVLTGRRPNHVTSMLDRARKLDPSSTEPYRYSAIYQVNTFFQYKTALADIAELLERSPDDLFGLNTQGFLLYRLGEYRKSLHPLERALEVEPDNVYAMTLMARNYTLLYNKTSRIDPRRNGYLESALQMLDRAQDASTPDTRRVDRLRSWMASWGVL